MTSQEKIAKVIRGITIPPLLVCILILVLSYTNAAIFVHSTDRWMCILFLAIIPVLAYPLQPLLPSIKEKGREGQRTLAFILSLIGYLGGVIYGYATAASSQLQLVFNTYLLSVILLTIYNKLLKLRASGHACSITGPFVFSIYFIGWYAIIPCVIVAACVVWSSLLLKRHTVKDLTTGCLICIVSFFLCSFI